MRPFFFCPQDSFFTAMLSGRISTQRDETGAIFIDRDPELFRLILNYLRNRSLSFEGVNVKELRHEAEFYGIGPLIRKLTLCADLNVSGCGDVLFHRSVQKTHDLQNKNNTV